MYKITMLSLICISIGCVGQQQNYQTQVPVLDVTIKTAAGTSKSSTVNDYFSRSFSGSESSRVELQFDEDSWRVKIFVDDKVVVDRSTSGNEEINISDGESPITVVIKQHEEL